MFCICSRLVLSIGFIGFRGDSRDLQKRATFVAGWSAGRPSRPAVHELACWNSGTSLPNQNLYSAYTSFICADCSDLDDVTAAHDSCWSDGSEHSLVLFHPGCKPQQPIGPITLQTLAASQNKSAIPSGECQQEAAVGCDKTLVAHGRTSLLSEDEQMGVAQLGAEQLSLKKHPSPDSAACSDDANPCRTPSSSGKC